MATNYVFGIRNEAFRHTPLEVDIIMGQTLFFLQTDEKISVVALKRFNHRGAERVEGSDLDYAFEITFRERMPDGRALAIFTTAVHESVEWFDAGS